MVVEGGGKGKVKGREEYERREGGTSLCLSIGVALPLLSFTAGFLT